jgi:peptide/nickel transport system substrate-binding protein
VVYPADLFTTITWHDGSPLSVADFVYSMIVGFDFGYEASINYDAALGESLAAFLAHFKGVRIVSTDPLTIEHYDDLWALDAEANVTTWWPNYTYGPGAWHNVTVGALADAAKELAFSADKADAESIEWMSFIAGPSLEILKKYLDQAATEVYIPFAPTMGAYITADEATARYANLTAWYEARNNFWIGTGPFYLYQVYPVEGTVTIQRNAAYPDSASKWSGFGSPKLSVVEIDGAGSITKGAEALFDVYVTYEDVAYPAAEIAAVNFLVFDATGALVASGPAEAVADGQYAVKLSADVTNALASGAYKLEVTVVSILVAIPTFAAFEFIVP